MKRINFCILFTCVPIILFAQSGNIDINQVINEVNRDYLEQTIKELSGEKSISLNGKTDTIKTRYCFHDDITKVHQYLQNRFEEYDLDVDVQPFSCEQIVDLKFCKDDPTIGWLITNNGHIYGTTDKGNNWQMQFILNGLELNSIVIINCNMAFVAANSGVVKTTDGINWQYDELYQNDHNCFKDIFFINDSVGYLSSAIGNLYKTNDAGNSWNIVPGTSPGFYKIFFSSESKGWAITDNLINCKIIYTENGGISWQYQAYDSVLNNLSDILFLNDSVGFIAAGEGKIFKTENGGKIWKSLVISNNTTQTDIQFINDSVGFAINSKDIYKTADYGDTWEIFYKGDIFDNVEQKGIYLNDTNEMWTYGYIYRWHNISYPVLRFSSNGFKSFSDISGNVPFQTNKNIIATKPGKVYPDKYLILCAHFDGINFENNILNLTYTPGANDNATGVATVIEAARILSEFEYDYSLKFVLFDAEEKGLYGSNMFVRDFDFDNQEILGVVNLDMIGYDGNNDGAMDIYAGGLEGSQAIGKKAESNVAFYHLDLVPEYSEDIEWEYSDHASFWEESIPAIHIMEDYNDLNPYFHTQNDLLINISFNYYLEISKLSIGTFAELAIHNINTANEYHAFNNCTVGDAFPNPASSNVFIPITLSDNMYINISAYNINGQKISTIYSDYLLKGTYEIEWTIGNKKNINIPGGVYILKVQTPFYQNYVKVLIGSSN